MFYTEVLQGCNLDLKKIVTPVNVPEYEQLLLQTGYPKNKINYLVDGFKNGFDINYKGPAKVQRMAPNLPLRVGNKTILWNKVMTEVQAGRYAGPFEKIPFKYYIQSPIGLVPKDKGKKTRLIFHLSYPKTGDSVNSGIPDEMCTVKYPDFNEAVKLCVQAGRFCYVAKSDMSMAFRNLPLKKKCWKFLVMKAEHPETGQIYFFVEKCLPFGSSISPKIFQDFSDSIAHIIKSYTHQDLVNYLDYFLFVQLLKALCDGQVQIFLDVCQRIRFPVSLEKTFWGTTWLVFLGLLIDTVNQVVIIPQEKISKAMDMIEFFLNKNNKSVTVLQVQKLTGTLNFLCKCVIPGRVFLLRLYKFCRPFLDLVEINAEDIDMFSDASRNFTKGAQRMFCPFQLLDYYLQLRGDFDTYSEVFYLQ